MRYALVFLLLLLCATCATCIADSVPVDGVSEMRVGDGEVIKDIRENIRERILIRQTPEGIAEVVFDGQLVSIFVTLIWFVKMGVYMLIFVCFACTGLTILFFIRMTFETFSSAKKKE